MGFSPGDPGILPVPPFITLFAQHGLGVYLQLDKETARQPRRKKPALCRLFLLSCTVTESLVVPGGTPGEQRLSDIPL